jgi:hypothetical protein
VVSGAECIPPKGGGAGNDTRIASLLTERARRDAPDLLVALLLAERTPSEGKRGAAKIILLARRTCTMKLCSSDARSEG